MRVLLSSVATVSSGMALAAISLQTVKREKVLAEEAKIASAVYRGKLLPTPAQERLQQAKDKVKRECHTKMIQAGIPGIVIGVAINGKMAFKAGQN